MDADRFDTLARSLTVAGSRRDALVATLGAVLGTVLGASSAERIAAKKKPCPPCKKRKKGKCKKTLPDGTACPTGECRGGQCIAPTCFDGRKNGNETDVDCGGSCPKCGTGKRCQGAGDCASGFCAQGRCVTGKGTCAAGENVCTGPSECNPGMFACSCVTTMQDQTRCASSDPIVSSNCGDCSSDEFCAAAYPNIPGAFCARGGGPGACCPGGIDGRCVAPCPA